MGQFAALVSGKNCELLDFIVRVKCLQISSELLQCISCEDIVCYGIGRFGTCCIARQQLALLLHIASAKEVRY